MNEEKLFQQISEAVLEMEDELVEELCNKSLQLSIPANKTITEGLVAGMDKVGQLYEEQEYFLPEVLTCSDTLNIGLNILRPHIKIEDTDNPIKVVIGVVEGDTHDIGKNLVKIMTESAGFEVYDLGGGPISQRFADEIGADSYTVDANEAVKRMKLMVMN